jgi:hypothetical protein
MHCLSGGILMKISLVIIILFFTFVIYIYGDDEFYSKEIILIERGYIKFDDDYFYIDIFMDCYNEITNKNWMLENVGIKHISLDIDDGFIYDLYYILEEKLPNILVIVYLKNDEKVHGYYKMNRTLDAIELSTTFGELLVFF